MGQYEFLDKHQKTLTVIKIIYLTKREFTGLRTPVCSRRALQANTEANRQEADLSAAEAWMPTLRGSVFAEARREFFAQQKTAKWVAFLLLTFLWRSKEK